MSNEEHMIFYGEKDIDYTKSNNYAFLNWDFDNSRGGKNNVYQSVEDNFVMGNAYMGNAVLGLFWDYEEKSVNMIFYDKNER